MKVCPRCGQSLPASEFTRNRTRKDGLSCYCRTCGKAYDRERYAEDPERVLVVQRKWRKKNHQHVRHYSRQWWKQNPDALRQYRYGITPEEYHQMHSSQKGCCAICELPESEVGKLHVDHDHENGVVRGLLCGKCNRGLGLLNDNAACLRRAAKYLSREMEN